MVVQLIFMHWATIRVKSRELVFSSSGELLREKGNTPDFMLEHFIIFFLNGTCVAPNQLELESTAMAIQHNYTQS